MAKGFNLTAQINLRGPANLKPVIAQIRKELGTVSADVKLNIDARSIKSVDAITSKLRTMNSVLVQSKQNVDSLNSSFRTLSSALSTSQSDTNKATSSINKTAESAASAAKTVHQAGTAMEEFGKQSFLAIKRFAAFSFVTTGIFALTNAITGGFRAFINFDKELVKLQQVTGKGASGIAALEKEITRLATTMGVSSESLINVASTLAQAGLSADETRTALEALAKTELAPSFDNLTDTTEGAIAAMRQFGLEAGQLESALGSINAVAAAFAVESKDIISAIQRTGGVFATASKGVSQGTDALNEFVAIFTSVRQTTRESAETIATGLRTIFTRIQRASTIQQLKEFGVVLTDLEGKFVGPFEAIKRLSEGLSRLDPRDLRFSQIVEELGGFRQIGKVIPLIQQFATAQEALKVAQKGQGSLTEAQIVAQQSLANQLAKVREQFLALIRDVGKSTVFQGLFKVVTGLASGLISLAGAFKPILPILAVMGAIKGVSAVTQFATGFFGGMGKGGGARSIGQNAGESISGAKEKEKAEATNRASQAITENTGAIRTLTTAINSLTTRVDANTSAINSRGASTLSGGGKVLGFNKGGLVPGYGGGDRVPALLEGGEVVINKRAVTEYGAGNLLKMNRYGRGGRSRKGNLGFSAPAPIIVDVNDTKIQASHVGKNFGSLYPHEIDRYVQMPVGRGNRSRKFEPVQTKSAGLTASETFKLGLPEIANQNMKRGRPGVITSSLVRWIKNNSNLLFTGRGSISANAIQVSPQSFADSFAGALESSSVTIFDEHLSDAFETVRNLIDPEYLTSRSGKVDLFSKTANSLARSGSQIRHEGFDIKKISDRFAFGGLVQKFVQGGTISDIANQKGISLQEAMLQQIQELGGISKIKSLMGQRAYDRTYDSILRAGNIKAGKNIPQVQSVLDSVLSKLKDEGILAAQEVDKATKVGIVGLQPFDYADTDGPLALGGKSIFMTIRGLSSKFADRVAKMRESIENVVKDFATGIQQTEIFGGVEQLRLDFDETLVSGADIFDSSGAIDIAGYSDLDRVKQSLSKGKLTQLGEKLREILSLDPSFMNRISVLTARPQSNAKLLSERLNQLGLPIPASKITGTSGGGKAKADAMGQAEKLIDDNLDNIRAAKSQGKSAIQYSEIRKLSDTEKAAAGFANIEGAVLESTLAALGARGGSIQNRAIDYENGLGPAAQYFPGIGPDWPTEVKRTLDSTSIGRAKEEFSRFYSQKFAGGGKISRKVPFERGVGPSPFVAAKVKKLGPEIYDLEKDSGLSKFEFNDVVDFARTNDFNFEEFKKYLQERIAQKKAKSNLMMNPIDLLRGITPDSSYVSQKQRDLAQSLMGEADAKYNPKYDNARKGFSVFAEGGDVKSKEKNYGKIGLRSSGSEITANYMSNSERSGFVTAKKTEGDLYTIGLSKATKGYGPRLYDVVMEAVTSQGGMLTSDRNQVSDSARAVWSFYFNRRSDVKKTPLDPSQWTKNQSYIDPKLYGRKETWPPSDDPAWILQSGYSKNPEIINSADIINLNDPKYTDFIRKQQMSFLSRRGGGSIPARVSNGEAFVAPKLAKKIGYSKLNKLNQADRNGMGFSGGGISVFKGPGSGTSDSISTSLPVGGYVIREKATKALGLYKNGGSIGIARFAGGGINLGKRGELILQAKEKRDSKNTELSDLKKKLENATGSEATVIRSQIQDVEKSLTKLEIIITKAGAEFDDLSNIIEKSTNVQEKIQGKLQNAEDDLVQELKKYKFGGKQFNKLNASQKKTVIDRAKRGEYKEAGKDRFEAQNKAIKKAETRLKTVKTIRERAQQDRQLKFGDLQTQNQITERTQTKAEKQQQRYADDEFLKYKAYQEGTDVEGYKYQLGSQLNKRAYETKTYYGSQVQSAKSSLASKRDSLMGIGTTIKSLEGADKNDAAVQTRLADAQSRLSIETENLARQMLEINPTMENVGDEAKKVADALASGDLAAAQAAMEEALGTSIDSAKAMDIAMQRFGKEMNIDPEFLKRQFGEGGASSLQKIIYSLGGPFKATTRALGLLGAASEALRNSFADSANQLSSQTKANFAFFENLGKGAAMAGELDIAKNVTSLGNNLKNLGGKFEVFGNVLTKNARAIQTGATVFTALSFAVSKSYEAYNQNELENSLKRLSAASSNTELAFKNLGKNQSVANVNAARRSMRDEAAVSGDLEARSMIYLRDNDRSNARKYASYDPTGVTSSVMGLPQEAEARKEFLQFKDRQTGQARQLGEIRLRSVNTTDTEQTMKEANEFNDRINQLEAQRARLVAEGADRTKIAAKEAEIRNEVEAKNEKLFRKSQTFATIRETTGATEDQALAQIFSEQGATTEDKERRFKLVTRATGTKEEQDKAIAAAKALAASEAENERISLALANAYKKVSVETENLIRVYDRASAMLMKFSQDIDRIKTSASQTADAYMGRASIGPIDRTNERILGNMDAYSLDEVRKAASDTGRLVGGGIGGENLQNQIVAGKLIQQELPDILANTTGTDGVGGAMSKLQEVFNNAGVELPKVVADELKTSLEKQLEGSRENASFDELMKSSDILAEVNKQTAAGIKVAQEFQKQYNDALQTSIELVNEYGKALAESTEWTLKASDIRARADIELAEALGRTVSLSEQNRPQEERIKGLTKGVIDGGSTDPNAIFNAMQAQISDRKNQEAILEQRKNALAANPEDKNALNNLAEQERYMARQNNSINNARKALEELANNTDAAARALKGLQEQQKMAAGSVNFLEKVLTSDSAELYKMNQGLAAYTKLVSGKATKRDVNSLQFRQQAFGGLKELQGLMPDSVFNQMQAKMSEAMIDAMPGGSKMLDQKTGALFTGEEKDPVTGKTKAVTKQMTFRDAIRMRARGEDPAQKEFINAYKAATAAQQAAAEKLAMASQNTAASFQQAQKEALDTLSKELPNMLEKILKQGMSADQEKAYDAYDAATKDQQKMDIAQAEKLGLKPEQFDAASKAYSNIEKAKKEQEILEQDAAKRVGMSVDEFRSNKDEYNKFKTSNAYTESQNKITAANESFNRIAIDNKLEPDKLKNQITTYRQSDAYKQSQSRVQTTKDAYLKSKQPKETDKDKPTGSATADMTSAPPSVSTETNNEETKKSEDANAVKAYQRQAEIIAISVGAAVFSSYMTAWAATKVGERIPGLGGGGRGAAGGRSGGGTGSGGTAPSAADVRARQTRPKPTTSTGGASGGGASGAGSSGVVPKQQYRYTAIDAATGKEVVDTVEATTPQEAQDLIRKRGQLATKLETPKNPVSSGTKPSTPSSSKPTVPQTTATAASNVDDTARAADAAVDTVKAVSGAQDVASVAKTGLASSNLVKATTSITAPLRSSLSLLGKILGPLDLAIGGYMGYSSTSEQAQANKENFGETLGTGINTTFGALTGSAETGDSLTGRVLGMAGYNNGQGLQRGTWYNNLLSLGESAVRGAAVAGVPGAIVGTGAETAKMGVQLGREGVGLYNDRQDAANREAILNKRLEESKKGNTYGLDSIQMAQAKQEADWKVQLDEANASGDTAKAAEIQKDLDKYNKRKIESGARIDNWFTSDQDIKGYTAAVNDYIASIKAEAEAAKAAIEESKKAAQGASTKDSGSGSVDSSGRTEESDLSMNIPPVLQDNLSTLGKFGEAGLKVGSIYTHDTHVEKVLYEILSVLSGKKVDVPTAPAEINTAQQHNPLTEAQTQAASNSSAPIPANIEPETGLGTAPVAPAQIAETQQAATPKPQVRNIEDLSEKELKDKIKELRSQGKKGRDSSEYSQAIHTLQTKVNERKQLNLTDNKRRALGAALPGYAKMVKDGTMSQADFDTKKAEYDTLKEQQKAKSYTSKSSKPLNAKQQAYIDAKKQRREAYLSRFRPEVREKMMTKKEKAERDSQVAQAEEAKRQAEVQAQEQQATSSSIQSIAQQEQHHNSDPIANLTPEQKESLNRAGAIAQEHNAKMEDLARREQAGETLTRQEKNALSQHREGQRISRAVRSSTAGNSYAQGNVSSITSSQDPRDLPPQDPNNLRLPQPIPSNRPSSMTPSTSNPITASASGASVPAQLLTLDPASLDGLNTFNSNFASYVDKLIGFQFPTIPDKIELVGSYDLNVQITGAAALEGLDKRMKELAISLVEPKLEQLRNEVSAATQGAVKPSAAKGKK